MSLIMICIAIPVITINKYFSLLRLFLSLQRIEGMNRCLSFADVTRPVESTLFNWICHLKVHVKKLMFTCTRYTTGTWIFISKSVYNTNFTERLIDKNLWLASDHFFTSAHYKINNLLFLWNTAIGNCIIPQKREHV